METVSAPTCNQRTLEETVQQRLSRKLRVHGVEVTWLPDLAEHYWRYNTDLQRKNEAGDVECKKISELLKEVLESLTLPQSPDCAEAGCGDRVYLMVHHLTCGHSVGRSVLYYQPECAVHGVRKGGERIISATIGVTA